MEVRRQRFSYNNRHNHFAIIAVFFGWLSPFDYMLAGDEGEDDDRKYTAESNAEVIDGYTKMIKTTWTFARHITI